MVKTRSQNSKDCATNNIIITEGIVTRSQKHKYKHLCQDQKEHTQVQKALKKKVLPKVELTDRVKDKIRKRQQLRKHICRNQTSILSDIHMDAMTSKIQNNQEMTSVWKNFESVFKYIDDFMSFKKRVEGK
jgi:hypothetical protein